MAYTRASILSATAEIQDHTKALKTGNTNDSISISFSRFSPIPSLLLCFPLPQISGLFFHLFSLLHFISFIFLCNYFPTHLLDFFLKWVVLNFFGDVMVYTDVFDPVHVINVFFLFIVSWVVCFEKNSDLGLSFFGY